MKSKNTDKTVPRQKLKKLTRLIRKHGIVRLSISAEAGATLTKEQLVDTAIGSVKRGSKVLKRTKRIRFA